MRANNKKRQKEGFWGELFDRLPFVGAFVLMSVLAGTMLFSADGLPLYFSMRDSKHQLEERIQQLEFTNVSMKKDIARVQRDPTRLEELARNRLGMVRRGEKVYQFVEPPSSSITAKP